MTLPIIAGRAYRIALGIYCCFIQICIEWLTIHLCESSCTQFFAISVTGYTAIFFYINRQEIMVAIITGHVQEFK